MIDFIISLLIVSVSCSAFIVLFLLVKRLTAKFSGAWWSSIIWLLVLLRLCIPVMLYSPIGTLNTETSIQSVFADALIADNSNITSNEDNQSLDIKNHLNSNYTNPLKLHDKIYTLSVLSGIVYMSGFSISFFLFLRKLIFSFRSVHKMEKCSDPETISMLNSLKSQLKIKRGIHLLISDELSSPALFGLFNSYIIIPYTAKENLKYVLIHELSHLKRNDIAKLWLVEAAIMIHWFNPLLHIIKSKIICDFELSCDETVLSFIGKHQYASYCNVLAHFSLMDSTGRLPTASILALKSKKQLYTRLFAISRYNKTKSSVSGTVLIVVLIILLSLSTTERLDKYIPEKYDWRDYSIVLEPQDQKIYGTGTMFAINGIFESNIALKTGKLINLSEQYIINNIADYNIEDGICPDCVLKFLSDNGTIPEQHQPYAGTKAVSKKEIEKKYIIESWESIDLESYTEEKRVDIIKQSVMEYGPIVTNIIMYKDMLNYNGGIYSCDTSSDIINAHYVQIIGWCDDKSLQFGGYWIVKESWGTNWGNDGYINISYNDLCGIDNYIIYYIKN